MLIQAWSGLSRKVSLWLSSPGLAVLQTLGLLLVE